MATLLLLTNSIFFTSYACLASKESPITPIVINTWNFKSAGEAAWKVLQQSDSSALDAVQAGCTQCEIDQCDTTVGFGGSPDENGEVRLDSMIMDGTTLNVGAVGSMGRIKQASAVARHVLDNTEHTLIVGDLATSFAVNMGYEEETLETNFSKSKWENWKENQSCQPNFWKNVIPDSTTSCGPYHPNKLHDREQGTSNSRYGNRGNHDTIGMIALDKEGHVAAGTSTNGASFKIPGRVGDSPIPGSGAYADSDVGGAAATGDGDVMMRFLPSFLAVELMRIGHPPELAARTAIDRIVSKYPNFIGAVVALSKEGNVGAACHNLDDPFPYVVGTSEGVHIHYVECVRSDL